MVTASAVGPGRPVGIGGDRRHQRRQGGLVGGPRVEPGLDLRRDGVGAVGGDRHLAEGGDRVVCRGLRAGVVHGGGERQHRIAPVDQAGGPGVVGLAAEGESPAAVRPDRRGDRDRSVRPDPVRGPARREARRTPQRAQQDRGPRRRARGCGPPPTVRRPGCCRRRRAGSAHVRRRARPVDSCDPTHATPNRAPSSSENATTATGTAGLTPSRAQEVDRGERRDDTQWAVECPTVGNRVQMRAGDEGADGITGPPRWHPPRPEVAVAVLFHRHARAARLAGEPFPQREIGCASRRIGGSRR